MESQSQGDHQGFRGRRDRLLDGVMTPAVTPAVMAMLGLSRGEDFRRFEKSECWKGRTLCWQSQAWWRRAGSEETGSRRCASSQLRLRICARAIARNFAWVGLYQAPLRMIARVCPRCGVWAETQQVHCNWRPESHKPQLQWSTFSIIDYTIF